MAPTCCHCCRPATNVLEPLLIMRIWYVIAFLLSPFVPAHFCRGERRCWLLDLLTQWSAEVQLSGRSMSCFCKIYRMIYNGEMVYFMHCMQFYQTVLYLSSMLLSSPLLPQPSPVACGHAPPFSSPSHPASPSSSPLSPPTALW